MKNCEDLQSMKTCKIFHSTASHNMHVFHESTLLIGERIDTQNEAERTQRIIHILANTGPKETFSLELSH